MERQKIGRHADWVATVQQAAILQQHSTSRHVWTAAVLWRLHWASTQVCCSYSDISTLYTEWHWTSRPVCCIDNVAVLPDKVSQCWLACLMEGNRSSRFSLWFSMDQEVCLIKWYQIRRHICWSFTEQQPCNAARLSHQACLPSHAFNYVVLNQYTCLFTRLCTSSYVCWLHPISNNVCYNCTQLTGMLGTLALDQQACLFKLHPTSLHVCPTCVIATGSADIFTIIHVWLRGTGPTHMSETKQFFL